MSAKDLHHNTVVNALKKEDWVITDDPLIIHFLNVELRIDLGIERVIAAERNDKKIAIEIKGFSGSSAISDFHTALGQYIDYREALKHKEPERILYLAIPLIAYETFFRLPFGQHMVQQYQLNLLVYEPDKEVILEWIP